MYIYTVVHMYLYTSISIVAIITSHFDFEILKPTSLLEIKSTLHVVVISPPKIYFT